MVNYVLRYQTIEHFWFWSLLQTLIYFGPPSSETHGIGPYFSMPLVFFLS